jgi:hypothetical protein
VWGDEEAEDGGDAASTGMGASASEVGQAPRVMRWDEALRYASFAVVAVVVSLVCLGLVLVPVSCVVFGF